MVKRPYKFSGSIPLEILLGIIVINLMIFTLSIEAPGEEGQGYKHFSGALVFNEPFNLKMSKSLISKSILLRFNALNTIVIDPGHGGKDTGAVGPTGLEEKELSLRIAKALKNLLHTGLGSKVFLTRESDSLILHGQRAGMANGLKADLFISIHSAVSPEKTMKGLEIFITSKSIGSSPAGARSSRSDNGEITSWDRAGSKYVPLSRLLGRLIQLNLNQEMGEKATVKEWPMLTLKGVNMPALELNVGYITTLSTESQLKSGVYINQLVTAVYKGIKQYKEALLLSRGRP